MHPAIDSGIVTGHAPVSYWPIFCLSLEGRKESWTIRGQRTCPLYNIYINIITVSLDVSIQRRHRKPSLRTPGAFPVVASLPPTGNASAVRRLLTAAIVPFFVSLLHLPNPWLEWCVRVGHKTGAHVPCSFRTAVHLRPTRTDKFKCCETGPTVFPPYPRRLESLTVCRCHHFVLSYLKTLSVGLAGVWTHDLSLSRPALSQLS